MGHCVSISLLSSEETAIAGPGHDASSEIQVLERHQDHWVRSQERDETQASDEQVSIEAQQLQLENLLVPGSQDSAGWGASRAQDPPRQCDEVRD